VLTQIDGNPPPPVCFVPPCVYVADVNPIRASGFAETHRIIMTRKSGTCDWQASTNDSWITLRETGGGPDGPLNFSLAQNTGAAARTGVIHIRFGDGSLDVLVNQPGGASLIKLDLYDSNRSTGPVPDCYIVFPTQQCQVGTTSFLPTGISNYEWKAEYSYGDVAKTATQGGINPVFTIQESCGGAGSTTTGAESDLKITLQATDFNGAVTTVTQTFKIRFFTCS
jgi:hypothetical protein